MQSTMNGEMENLQRNFIAVEEGECIQPMIAETLRKSSLSCIEAHFRAEILPDLTSTLSQHGICRLPGSSKC